VVQLVFIRGVNEDCQLIVERLDLDPMKGKAGGEELVLNWCDSFRYTSFALGENGFAGDGHPAVIGRSDCVAENFKKQDKSHKERRFSLVLIVSFIKQQCVQKFEDGSRNACSF
jgi:hypothetical protein